MKINLYYVEGISRIDTPSFNTKTHTGTIQDQEEFFLTKLVKSIDSTFYPPYYRNSIKFDQTDLVITDNVNYLSLEYNGKTYYYFIDEINYTSTGIITLEVSMDTIQTFMFDIYISSGIIERKFINRWIGDKINRNYKRENLSDGLYTFESVNDITPDEHEWFIVKKDVKANTHAVENLCGLKYERTYYPCDIEFQTYLAMDIDITLDAYGELPSYYTLPIRFLNYIAADAHCSSLFVIPFSPFIRSDYNPETKKFDYDKFIGNEILGVGISKIYLNYTKLISTDDSSRAILVSDVKHYTYNFTFEKNINKNVPFLSKYEPVMFDENYIRFIFGSRSSNTTTSLFKYDSPTLLCCYYASIIEGSRFYYISSSSTEYREDNYRTLVSDVAPIKLDLISDSYAQFNETNKLRWLEAVGKTAVSASMLFGGIAIKGAFAAADIAKIASTSLTPKRQKVSKKGQRAIESIQRSIRDELPSNIEKGIGSVSPIASQGIQDINMMFTPDTIKQTSSNNDISSCSYRIICELQKVNDYEQCAQYYHRNGYLVQDYITQVSNIFLHVRNRYYFDILKMNVPEVHLHNVIEDEDTVGLIEERLETGLRLWNVKNSDVIMGDFTYDNVELDYLS